MDRRLTCAFFATAWMGLVAAAAPAGDPLTAPIAEDQAPRFMAPKAPGRLHGDTWLIGSANLNVVLIDTGAGLVLIDGGLPQAAPVVEANLRSAGFSIKDVKLILSSEPHYDHAGALAALSRDSGATVLAGAGAVPVLRAGRSGEEDPQRTSLFAYPGVSRVRAVKDGETIRLGRIAITAHATPGHTPGSTSWTWRSCAGGACKAAAFVASLNSLTDGTYRYSDRPAVVTAFRATFAKVRALPCDILVTGHPDHAGDQPSTPGACRRMADRYEAALDQRLAAEAK